MDGVLVRGNKVIPGADLFIERLKKEKRKFLILTNNSERTPRDLQHRLEQIGLRVTVEHLYTSALATASFLSSQKPKGTAFVIGGSGLIDALHQAGYIITEYQPDYVVVGDTQHYDYHHITQAIRFIQGGARLIGANPDVTGPSDTGIVPATGALVALIEKAVGCKAYFVGKPNPLMMRSALRKLGEHSENTIMVGDRMDTDVVVGIESGLETILVLSGVTKKEDIEHFPYRPTRILDSVTSIEI
ncbi:MAG TPA: HAD-IIA family hydrolase [Nitrospiria bacterium]